MKEIVQAFDNLPFLVKLILAFPFIDGIAYGIYRVAKGIDRNDIIMIVAGIVWLLIGWAILWIIDLISVILYRKVVLFA